MARPADWSVHAALANHAVAWDLTARVYGKFALAVAEHVAAHAGVELKQARASGRNCQPRWSNAAYPITVESDIQCVTQGW
eukprot:7003863-Pyramimonas_sp.AAC.2